MMTEHLAKKPAPHPQCQAPTASSPLKESWWTCSTLLMNLDSMLLDLTCQPRPLLLLMCRGCLTIWQRLTEEYSKYLVNISVHIFVDNLLLKINLDSPYTT